MNDKKLENRIKEDISLLLSEYKTEEGEEISIESIYGKKYSYEDMCNAFNAGYVRHDNIAYAVKMDDDKIVTEPCFEEFMRDTYNDFYNDNYPLIID